MCTVRVQGQGSQDKKVRNNQKSDERGREMPMEVAGVWQEDQCL